MSKKMIWIGKSVSDVAYLSMKDRFHDAPNMGLKLKTVTS